MTRIQKVYAAGISLVFFTGIFLYFFYKFTDRWGAALVVAAGLTLFQLVLWLPARRHSLLSFVSAFIPAGVFAQVFATGGLRSCAGLWIGIGLTVATLVLNRFRWPSSRSSTQTWTGILAALVLFSAIAGILSVL